MQARIAIPAEIRMLTPRTVSAVLSRARGLKRRPSPCTPRLPGHSLRKELVACLGRFVGLVFTGTPSRWRSLSRTGKLAARHDSEPSGIDSQTDGKVEPGEAGEDMLRG